ncbi:MULTISPECIES: type IV pilus biogenesis/stability protein PilW [Acinetobacter]|uniref:Type IV pilus biogenesis/stability protein PilW n=1 Tax=Acinetobacter brisouii CIP 110357 TaxID=1341683 RepID=V2VRF1_9GAMM|nr:MULTISPECIES: type IV pilus biogenesis/stability protein PilW [Acinetobacter]ENV46962.1 type IV pilus biogenesis/stability protein PilW [Acinetobacter brisouii ANC 4119]ESK50264.1 type IV pilus biogenesis/stability protein PilW [Acinetobacter brisouii CIP 110357]PVZ86094.1 type IV pilus biogenesis/stability protein PilW [Serratia sp. S1B]TCB31616.1 type IV pilus biogenesis/stability protein PilW [Acinetobacter sp. ANC 4635]
MKKTVKHSVILLGVGALLFSLQGCQSTLGLVKKDSSPSYADISTPTSKFKRDKKKAAEIRVEIAAEYLRTGDLDAAKRALDDVFQETTRNVRANMLMAVLLQQEGSPENVAKAEEYFKRAISIDPQDAQTRNNYGRYLFQLGRYNDALEQLKLAGSTLGYEQRGMALENLGLTYLKLGDAPNAEKTFRQALQVNRNSTVSMLELAEIFYLRQQFALATEAYGDYVRLVGDKNQSAHGLWVGIRLARANGDNMSKQVLVNQLRALFPDSQEYQRYLQLQYSTEAVWK